MKIGTAINIKPADAKKRRRNLRDRYAREKRKLLTEGKDVYLQHDKWPYFEDMAFLRDHIIHRNNSDNNPDPVIMEVDVDLSFCTLLHDDSDLQPQFLEHPEESRVNTPNSDRSDYGSLQEMNIDVSDEDQLFSLAVAATLKRFTAKAKAATKIKIQQILFDSEFSENNNPSNET